MSDPSYNPMHLDGRTYLVTGASSGIGRATSVVLSRLGARVILSGRRADALEETRGAMFDADRHLVETFDLAANVDAIPAWVKEISTRASAPLDGFVHSAGIGATSPVRTLNRRNIDDILLPNLHAALLLIRGASAKGVAAGRPSFVLLSSVAAMVGTKGLATYTASKGALHALVKSVAQELAEKNVRVNCVAPAYVETPLLTQAQTELPGEFEHLKRQFLGVIKAEDVGVACAYLLSDAARAVTGTVLVIDSGYTL